MKNSDLNAIVERVLQRIVEVEESDPDDIEETTTDTSMTYGGNQANEVSKKTAKKQVKALGGPKFSDKEERRKNGA